MTPSSIRALAENYFYDVEILDSDADWDQLRVDEAGARLENVGRRDRPRRPSSISDALLWSR